MTPLEATVVVVVVIDFVIVVVVIVVVVVVKQTAFDGCGHDADNDGGTEDDGSLHRKTNLKPNPSPG